MIQFPKGSAEAVTATVIICLLFSIFIIPSLVCKTWEPIIALGILIGVIIIASLFSIGIVMGLRKLYAWIKKHEKKDDNRPKVWPLNTREDLAQIMYEVEKDRFRVWTIECHVSIEQHIRSLLQGTEFPVVHGTWALDDPLSIRLHSTLLKEPSVFLQFSISVSRVIIEANSKEN